MQEDSSVASTTAEVDSTVGDATQTFALCLFRALKGTAKIKLPLRGCQVTDLEDWKRSKLG